jgi:hypothetical protein
MLEIYPYIANDEGDSLLSVTTHLAYGRTQNFNAGMDVCDKGKMIATLLVSLNLVLWSAYEGMTRPPANSGGNTTVRGNVEFPMS